MRLSPSTSCRTSCSIDTACSTSFSTSVSPCSSATIRRSSLPFRHLYQLAAAQQQQIASHHASWGLPRSHRSILQPCPAQARPVAPPGTSLPPPSAVRVPHCGYHFDGTPRRFFEGWYWKVQIPGTPHSFAVIFSIEGPDGRSERPGTGIQVMGPGDGYICQFTPEIDCFWGDREDLALGAGIKATAQAPRRTNSGGVNLRRMVPEDAFFRQVEHGFQASYTAQHGRIIASEEGATGAPFSTVQSCAWGVTIKPVSGWGSASQSPKATAGWLSVFSVFEPHWQVLMAHGLASGWFEWDGERYEFEDAPAYAEKNWGGGFPSKWAWIQCNTFDGHPGVSVTAVGARRQLVLGVPGIEEDVGLIGVHLPQGDGGQEEFVELVPWAGEVDWQIEPWGKWRIHARSEDYEALVEARCEDKAGTVLRAPTATNGLAPFCRDTFAGECRLRVWRRDGSAAPGTLVMDATSSTAALEVGGGPWWTAWSTVAEMKEPLRSLVQLPIDVGLLSKVVPSPLRPPGL